MDPRIHVITLAVLDLDRALEFYRDGLGLDTRGVVATEFTGDESTPAGAIAIFELADGLLLALYPRTELAKDANISIEPPTAGGFSIGHIVGSKADVDALLQRAQAAGATLTDQPHDRPWGIYSGYFRDPDGHLGRSSAVSRAPRHRLDPDSRTVGIRCRASSETPRPQRYGHLRVTFAHSGPDDGMSVLCEHASTCPHD